MKAGQIIAGRYQLVSPIGEGAMGAVWRAEDQTLKRQVAIKFLFVKGTRDPQAMVDQFLREARIAASVQHRNVIQTVDFGTVDEWQPFMVMELLSGESLGDRLARQPPLTREQLIHIVSLTLRGLSAVHDAGIVHRDLKPQNIFLQRDSDAVYPKILDFGISRALEHNGDRASAIQTQEGLIVGTPDYMSPEQARGEANIDKRADIYSMGVIMYEGLTGRLPFDAETVGDLIVQIMTQEPPRVRDVAPDVPQALSDLVAQAMAKKRDHRFADARAMRSALLAIAEGALVRERHPAGAMSPKVPVPPPAAGLAPAGLPPLPPADSAIGSALAPLFVPEAPAATFPSPATGANGGSTWGDFEGLNAPQVFDSIRPPGDATPAAGAKPQRIVARVSDELVSVRPRAEGQGRSAGGGRKPRKSPRKSATPTEDSLDPLYAGGNQATLDIDYDRVRTAVRRPSVPRARAQPHGESGKRTRARTKLRLGAYVLPIAALLALAYAWSLPPLETGTGGSYPVAGSAPLPKAPNSPPSGEAAAAVADTAPSAPGLLRSTAESGLKQIRIGNKGRRSNPGQAPPHLRDVVF